MIARIEPPLTVGNVSWLGRLGLETEVNRIMRPLNNGKIGPEPAAAKLTGLVAQHREERRKNISRRPQKK